MKSITDTVFMIDNETVTKITGSGKTTEIKIRDIESIDENMFGLNIYDSIDKIHIPKQSDNYSDIKKSLKFKGNKTDQ